MPRVDPIESEDIPQPYQDLLVHESDMTPKLETFYRRRIHLQVMDLQDKPGGFSRLVVLVLDRDQKPVEFGAIWINLELFSPETQRLIRAGHQPLGTVLKEQHVEHTSEPQAFLRIRSDSVISSALRLTRTSLLYGRQNVIRDSRHRTLAEIIEILPPIFPWPAHQDRG